MLQFPMYLGVSRRRISPASALTLTQPINNPSSTQRYKDSQVALVTEGSDASNTHLGAFIVLFVAQNHSNYGRVCRREVGQPAETIKLRKLFLLSFDFSGRII